MDDVEVLRALVEEYSPSGHEQRAVGRFSDLAIGLGFDVRTDEVGNAIARIGRGSPRIVFLGHIDTVEGALPVRLEGDRLHGRGTCDAKGALASALVVASRHSSAGEILIIGAVGEERDSRGTRHLIQHLARPDFLIVGEPSGWDAVTIGYKGNLSLVVRVQGERAHLASPEPTTVEKGLGFLEELRRFCETKRGGTSFDSVAMKVHSIRSTNEGGPEAVELGLNFRLPPGLAAPEILGFLDRFPEPISYEVLDQSGAVQVAPRNEVVRALCAGIRDQGRRPTLLRKLGTSDLNLAVPSWQCPAAAYGPGDSHLDHTERESIAISDFLRGIAVLRVAFSRLATASLAASPTTALAVP